MCEKDTQQENRNSDSGTMACNPVAQYTVGSWQEFITTIMPFMARSSAGVHRFGLDFPPYLFRGQTQSSYELVASVFRLFENKGHVQFDGSFFKKERTVIGMVRNKLADYLDVSEWDLVAAAQHHEIPTRFLDWTSDPFVALTFAFRDLDNTESNDGEKSSPVVWVLKTNVDDFSIPEKEDSPIPEIVGAKTKIYVPNKIVGRIVAQEGYLMRQVVEKDRNGGYTVTPVENNETFKDRLWRIVFEEKAFRDIQEQLKKLKLDYKGLMNPENWGGLKEACEKLLKNQ